MPKTGRSQQAKIWQFQAETAAITEAWKGLDVDGGGGRSEKQAVMVVEFRSYGKGLESILGNGKPLTNQTGVVAT